MYNKQTGFLKKLIKQHCSLGEMTEYIEATR